MRVLIEETAIKKRVREIAREISENHRGKELVVLCVLKGAFVFAADLIRELEGVDVRCEFVRASSYGSFTESTGEVTVEFIGNPQIEGKRVLIVDDILDAGYTLKKIREEVESRKPESCEVCVLLDKPERRKVDVKVEYIGFRIPNKFVVGYGMDCAERFRNLKYVAVYEE